MSRGESRVERLDNDEKGLFWLTEKDEIYWRRLLIEVDMLFTFVLWNFYLFEGGEGADL